MYDNPGGFVDVSDLLVKKGRRIRVKRGVVTARVDPFAPSTSAVML